MKSAFISKLVVVKLRGELWEVSEIFRYASRTLNMVVEVPLGFITDFASVPRLPLMYAWVGNLAQEAAVIHDYLYQKHLVGKAKADRVFLEAMKVLKISFMKRWVMYLGVVVGGWKAYASGPDRFKIFNQK